MTIDDLLQEGRRALATAPFDVPRPGREAALILGRLTGFGEATLRARGERTVETATVERFRRWLGRRMAGEPVAYLFGEREFYGRPFHVDPRVLVPRPETEHLIEVALGLDLPPNPRILDIGSGSGAIAVTLALEIPGARVVASDLSPAALAVTRHNARNLGATLRCVGSDLHSAQRLDTFDLVVSNPPYIDPAAELSPEVRDHEPGLALFADDRGRAVLRRLLGAALDLRPGVAMVLELGHDQSEWLTATVRATFGLVLREIRRDLAGIPRTAVVLRESKDRFSFMRSKDPG